jgi:hypothetical protein
MANKSYEEGLKDGQKDSGRVKSAVELIQDALIPGRLPCEKGEDYEKGYKEGKKQSK